MVSGLAYIHDRELIHGDLQYREVGFRVGPDELGNSAAAVSKLNLNLVSVLDHVVVGQDVALRANNYP